MGVSTHSIEVNARLRAVYNQWTQFEEFPRFMEGVEEVRQEDRKRLFWRAKIGGKVKEWEAEITEQVPDQRIAWESVDGSSNSGTITFEKIDADWTRVNATIGYEPEGLLKKTGDALGIPSGRIEEDLKQFRDYIEERGRETGGWRGQVGEGERADLGVLPTTHSRLEEVADQPYEGQRETSERTASAQPRETARESTIEVPLSEEEVKVGKRTVGAGEVKLHKTVTTEQVNVPVELKREDAVVERVAASEMRPSGKEPFQEERIEVPLSREEPVVEKQIRVTGGVRIRKTEGVEQETIQETVRREDVDVDESGKAGDSRKGRIDPRTAGVGASPITGTEKSAPKKESAVLVTREQIQERAYLIAERRKSSGVGGDESGDWAQAERELRGEATGK
jgi:uncharacterized protein (TIGR02271 family)